MFSELFSGLGLLDLLVVVDAHLELWTRGIRKTSVEWKCVLLPVSVRVGRELMHGCTG